MDTELPEGVTTKKPSHGQNDFIFVMNFAGDEKKVDVGDANLFDMVNGGEGKGEVAIPGYGIKILKR